MITKKYAVLALLGIGALLSVPVMADAVKSTWLGVDCSTLKAGMVPICNDLNFLKDFHIDVLESNVISLVTNATTLKVEVDEMYEEMLTGKATVLEDPDNSDCIDGFPQIGWCPAARQDYIIIEDSLITESSFVIINYKSPYEINTDSCVIMDIRDGQFMIDCEYTPDGSTLSYMIVQ